MSTANQQNCTILNMGPYGAIPVSFRFKQGETWYVVHMHALK